MKISYALYFNKDEGRKEYHLLNFDYFDGNDYLAKLFVEKYGFQLIEKVDGIWFSSIQLRLENIVYFCIWHEDIGNYVYSQTQSLYDNNLLEERLQELISILNSQLEEK